MVVGWNKFLFLFTKIRFIALEPTPNASARKGRVFLTVDVNCGLEYNVVVSGIKVWLYS